MLESLNESWQGLDEKVLVLYTRISQKIPDENLYVVTALAGIAGMATTTMGGMSLLLNLVDTYVDNSFLKIPTVVAQAIVSVASSSAISLPDLVLNRYGIDGKLTYENESEIFTKDPLIQFFESWNRRIRLYVFLGGLTSLGKVLYEIGNFVITGEAPSENIAEYGMFGLGLSLTATSMFLKDRDPKLLQRKPHATAVLEYNA